MCFTKVGPQIYEHCSLSVHLPHRHAILARVLVFEEFLKMLIFVISTHPPRSLTTLFYKCIFCSIQNVETWAGVFVIARMKTAVRQVGHKEKETHT